MPEVSPFPGSVLRPSGGRSEKGGCEVLQYWGLCLPGGLLLFFLRTARWFALRVAPVERRLRAKSRRLTRTLPRPGRSPPGFCFLPMQMTALRCGRWEGAGQPVPNFRDKQAHRPEVFFRSVTTSVTPLACANRRPREGGLGVSHELFDSVGFHGSSSLPNS